MKNDKIVRKYQQCTCCVMDTTDSKISFDENGVCDWCNDYKNNIYPKWIEQLKNDQLLLDTAKKIKEDCQNDKYDCIIGMSGGVDSSYLCYVAKEVMGLRPLVYVVDTGWNLEVANENISRIVKGLDLDVYTDVVDWEEMKDLQLAFFKSQVPYQDFPQDHAIFASLYNFSVKNKIKYVLTGANNATECIRPPVEWVYINDIVMMKDIHRRFGRKKLKRFPMCSMVKYRVFYPIFHRMTRIAPLNMIEYDYDSVKRFLNERFGWEEYANKHYENVFTRFYEGYYLPQKFGYDKRKCYFSNMILVGKMTREEALEGLKKPGYSEEEMMEDKKIIAEKLGISVAEFDEIITGENKSYKDYRNSYGFIQVGTRILRKLGIEKKQFR